MFKEKTKEEAERIRDELVISGKHPEKILSFIEAREKDDREVSNLVSTYLDADHYAFVDYEDLSDHTEEEMARIFALLGVEERTVRSQMEKIHEGKRTRDYFRKERQEGVMQSFDILIDILRHVDLSRPNHTARPTRPARPKKIF